MGFQRQARAAAPAAPAPRSAPQVAQPAPKQQSLAPSGSGGGFPRAVRAQVITNPVAAARATASKQQAPKGKAASVAGTPFKGQTGGGLGGVKYDQGGGFLSHLGSDVLNTITGTPSGVMTFVVDPVVASGEAIYGGIGTPLHLPGAKAAIKASADIQRQGGKVLAETYHDYARRYGPTVHAIAAGHPLAAAEHLGHAFYEHPGLVALDAASAVSLAGAVTRGLGGVAARVAPESAAGRLGARVADTSILPGGARYRAPVEHTSKLAEDSAAAAEATISVPRRPYSKNPLTREFVQKPLERVVESKVRPALEDAAPGLFGQQARFNRAAAKVARETRLAGEEHLNATLGELVAPYAKTARMLKPIVTRMEALKNLPRGVAETVPHEADVVHLHLRGLLDQPGLSPVQARDRFLQTMRTNIAADKLSGIRTAAAEKNVARFAAIPEHYLDLNTAPGHIRQAVEEGRALIDETQRRAVESGLVTPETARASATRAVDVLLGGGKFDKEAGRIVTPEGFQAGPQARYMPDISATPMGRTAIGRATGRLTKPRTYQSHGTLISRGNVVTSPALPIHAARTVLAHEQLTGNVANLIKATAYREGGEIARGPKALRLLQSDTQGRVVLVSEKAVQHALSQMHELQPGQALDENMAGQLFHEVAPNEAAFKANPNDFIAIPKAAMDEWRTAAKAPGAIARHYDSALSLWKSGLLAFTPRWYTNNLITNTALYGLASGLDLRSLRDSASEAYKRQGVVPERVASTAAVEYGRVGPSIGRAEALPRFKNAAAAGFAFNNRLEGFWRRAAYIHAAKGLLRDEGGKFRHLSQEEVADRIAAMPDELKAEAIHMTEQFMGNFRNFSRTERDVIKRAIPFYSWMRFVGSLALGLPFRSPLRAQALALMAEANKVDNPQDFMRQLYNRGRINLPGGLAVRTTGMNPFSTVADLVGAATGGESKATAAVQSLASGGLGPLPQIAIGEITGRDPFTQRPYTAPPGYGGAVASFGQDPTLINPATGLQETFHPTPGFLEQLTESAPFASTVRQLLAGSRRPYDTTSMWDLIQNRLGMGAPAWQLFQPGARTGTAAGPVPYLSPALSLLGVPLQQVNPQAEQAQYLQNIARLNAARASTLRAQAKARARVGN